MGYESRIFITNRVEFKDGNDTVHVYAEKIADMRMCRMNNEFRNLFDKEIDYKLFIDNGDEETQTDMYGDTMTYTNCKTVIDYLENLIANGENYRRLTILLGLLKGINEEQWDNIQIVHYGY